MASKKIWTKKPTHVFILCGTDKTAQNWFFDESKQRRENKLLVSSFFSKIKNNKLVVLFLQADIRKSLVLLSFAIHDDNWYLFKCQETK